MNRVKKRRQTERKTDYLARKKILAGGIGRVVIRKTNSYLIAEYVESKNAQDKIIYGTSSKSLLNYGWPENMKGSLKSLPAGYLTGYLVGKNIKGKQAIFDFGLIRNVPKSRLFAVVKGVIDAGVNAPVDKKSLPAEDRIKGKHMKKEIPFDKIKAAIEAGKGKK